MLQRRFTAAIVIAAASACCGGTPEPPEDARRPDLVLVTIDTLRADRVGGGPAPALDALAARGVHFTRARAAVPLTLPSHVSMLTGALPPEHGVRENGVHVYGGSPPSVVRLLQRRGYRTAAFVGAYVLDRRFGLADGFDHYDDQIARDPRAVHRLEAERPANEVVDRAVDWLRRHGGAPPDARETREPTAGRPPPTADRRAPAADRRPPAADRRPPIFLWVHLYDPHAPYVGSYDAEVALAGAETGRLLRELRASGRDPIVIVAGDHGESLGEHGEATHGMLVYEAALRVPLIVAGPGIAAARRDDPVSLADVAATLAHFGGVTAPMGSARHLLGPPAGDREIYAESEYPRVAGWSPVHALVQDRWKLVVSRGAELYDLGSDAREQRDLARSRQSLASAMGQRLAELRAAKNATPPRAAAPEVAERLRALGYVAGSGAPIEPGEGPNPAEHIAAWGELEAALAGLATQPKATIPRLRALAAAYPDAPVFQSTYARALVESGAPRDALLIYRRVVARWPGDPVLFHDLAVAARAAGRAEEALRAEQAALAIEPSLPSAHNGVGLLMSDAGRHAGAADAFEAAVKGDPTNAEYWANLGNARRAAGDTRRAREAYRRASEIDPRSADAANGLGVLLVEERRPAEAVALFERAVAASPDFVEARLNLAIAYQESGQRERAAAAYRDVLARARPGSRERQAAADLLRSLNR